MCNICICITDPLCCTTETNTTLQINYIPTEILKKKQTENTLYSKGNMANIFIITANGVSLEKEMATHSSILAWEIPWTEEPGGLQSNGLQESDTT